MGLVTRWTLSCAVLVCLGCKPQAGGDYPNPEAIAVTEVTWASLSASDVSPAPGPKPKPGDVCPQCNGTGTVGDGRIEVKCLECNTTGKVQHQYDQTVDEIADELEDLLDGVRPKGKTMPTVPVPTLIGPDVGKVESPRGPERSVVVAAPQRYATAPDGGLWALRELGASQGWPGQSYRVMQHVATGETRRQVWAGRYWITPGCRCSTCQTKRGRSQQQRPVNKIWRTDARGSRWATSGCNCPICTGQEYWQRTGANSFVALPSPRATPIRSTVRAIVAPRRTIPFQGLMSSRAAAQSLIPPRPAHYWRKTGPNEWTKSLTMTPPTRRYVRPSNDSNT